MISQMILYTNLVYNLASGSGQLASSRSLGKTNHLCMELLLHCNCISYVDITHELTNKLRILE